MLSSGYPTTPSCIWPHRRTAQQGYRRSRRSAPFPKVCANAASSRLWSPSRPSLATTACSRSEEGRLMEHAIVSREEWLAARQALLAAEKKLAQVRAAVVDQRHALPWTRVDKAYAFDTPAGRQTLAELFEGRSRLIVYHFMFAPEWQDGCPGCSVLGDHLDGLEGPLARQDAIFTAISRAPLERIEAYRKR